MSHSRLTGAATEPLSVRVAAAHAIPPRRGRPLLIALLVSGVAAATSILAAGVVIFSGVAPPHAAGRPFPAAIEPS